MSDLAARVKRLSAARGLSQKELAAVIGVSPAAVANWEAGTRSSVRGKALFALASALGVTPEDLLSGTEATDAAPVEELQLLAAYRQLSGDRKKIALHLVKALKSAA